MKLFFTAILISIFGTVSHAQWQTLNFTPDSVQACSYTEMKASVLGWRGAISSSHYYDCIDGELLSDGETIRIESTITDSLRRLSANLSSQVIDTALGRIQLPWSESEFGVVKIRVISAVTGQVMPVNGNSSFTLGPLVQSSGVNFIQPRLYVPVAEQREAECDFRIIEGGQSIYLSHFYFTLDDAIDLTNGFDFRIEYGFEVVDATRYTSLLAPPSAFDGQSYTVQLEDDHTQFDALYPDEFVIGLEQNTLTAQQIRILKQGGSFELDTYNFEVQQSSQTNEEHDVSFEFNDVNLCLNGEWSLPSGTSFSISNSNIGFAGQFSCIAVPALTKLEFRGVSPQDYAGDGLGMLLLLDSSEVVVQPYAEVTFGGIVATFHREDEFPETKLTLKQGAKFTVGSTTQILEDYEERSQPKSIKVFVDHGAIFDMSAAKPEVQALFDVQQQPNTEVRKTKYSVFPNPTSMVTTIGWTQNEVPAKALELYDLTGRLIFIESDLLGLDHYRLSLPQAGVYTLRVLDQSGEASYYQVVSQ